MTPFMAKHILLNKFEKGQIPMDVADHFIEEIEKREIVINVSYPTTAENSQFQPHVTTTDNIVNSIKKITSIEEILKIEFNKMYQNSNNTSPVLNEIFKIEQIYNFVNCSLLKFGKYNLIQLLEMHPNYYPKFDSAILNEMMLGDITNVITLNYKELLKKLKIVQNCLANTDDYWKLEKLFLKLTNYLPKDEKQEINQEVINYYN